MFNKCEMDVFFVQFFDLTFPLNLFDKQRKEFFKALPFKPGNQIRILYHNKLSCPKCFHMGHLLENCSDAFLINEQKQKALLERETKRKENSTKKSKYKRKFIK